VCRIEERRGLSQLGVARSADGVGHWRIQPHPPTAERRLYYGADTCTGLATASLPAVLDYLLALPEPAPS
jgi:predicted GH43/DUF377 family glycosyl hydrolase